MKTSERVKSVALLLQVRREILLARIDLLELAGKLTKPKAAYLRERLS